MDELVPLGDATGAITSRKHLAPPCWINVYTAKPAA